MWGKLDILFWNFISTRAHYSPMKTRLTILFVVLLVAIAIASQWWHDEKIIPVVPMVESLNGIVIADPAPVESGELKAKFEVLDGDGDIEVAPLIDLPEGVEVRGWVKDQQGQGISGMQIEISSNDSTAIKKNTYSGITDSSGEFLIPAVPSGNEYYLEVLASGTFSGNLLSPFLVDSDMSSVTVTLDSVVVTSVDGMILGENNTPVASFEILVQNVDIAYPGRKVISDESGFFHLGQFPVGELVLSTTGNEHFKVTGITLQPDEYRNLNVVLDKGSYYLSGWVSNEFGTPVAQARVVLTAIFLIDD
jgi:hypothetical protein